MWSFSEENKNMSHFMNQKKSINKNALISLNQTYK